MEISRNVRRSGENARKHDHHRTTGSTAIDEQQLVIE
jgi:hypothetical protein